MKRRVAILRSMSREEDAISTLVEFVEAFPTDAEAWCELAELYQSQGMNEQAIFSLEEALLITPNSWNVGVTTWPLLTQLN
jgi:tetratricopeptide (TPR) repeat protein